MNRLKGARQQQQNACQWKKYRFGPSMKFFREFRELVDLARIVTQIFCFCTLSLSQNLRVFLYVVAAGTVEHHKILKWPDSQQRLQ